MHLFPKVPHLVGAMASSSSLGCENTRSRWGPARFGVCCVDEAEGGWGRRVTGTGVLLGVCSPGLPI